MILFRRRFRRHLQPTFRCVTGLALGLWLAGCVSSTSQPQIDNFVCRDGESWQVQELLYFGTRTPQGFVSKSEWAAFVEHVITPRFPQGLTVLAGSGQWQGASGDIVREPSYVLSLIYPQSQQKDGAIADVIREYKRQFQQEAVLRVRSEVCVSFP